MATRKVTNHALHGKEVNTAGVVLVGGIMIWFDYVNIKYLVML